MFCNINIATYLQQEVSFMLQTLFNFHEIFTEQSPPHILERDVILFCTRCCETWGHVSQPAAVRGDVVLSRPDGVGAWSTLFAVLIVFTWWIFFNNETLDDRCILGGSWAVQLHFEAFNILENSVKFVQPSEVITPSAGKRSWHILHCDVLLLDAWPDKP